jgi:hypothetical protein
MFRTIVIQYYEPPKEPNNLYSGVNAKGGAINHADIRAVSIP